MIVDVIIFLLILSSALLGLKRGFTKELVCFLGFFIIIILAFVLGYGMGLSKFLMFYPLVLLVQYVLLIGISFIVSSVTVYFRDLQHFIGIALQLLFYATPIVYAPNTIPENFQWILKFNPMTYVINGYRDIFYYKQMPDLSSLAIVFAISIVVCLVGYFIFSKLQRRFAEEL